MLCIFWDHVKQIELLTKLLVTLPEVKDTVVIRGVIYIVTRKTYDYTEAEPVCRLDCEIRV